MRVPDFDQLVIDLLVADDHPEIVAVRPTATEDRPNYHNRLEIHCADGSMFYVMVARVEGQGVPRHTPFELPSQVMSA
jgi:hypothetical protein